MLATAGRETLSGNIFDEAKRRVVAGAADTFIYIVPNRVAQKRIERELIAAASPRAVPRVNVLTLADFAEVLTRVAFPDLRRIDDAEAAVLIEMSLRKLVDERRLKFFERASGSFDPKSDSFPIPRGTFELVVNTIRQLKESGVTPNDIASDLAETRKRKGETTEVLRASDILLIYEEYQRTLVGRFMDTYGQTLLLVERYSAIGTGLIAADFRARFPNVSEIWMESFYHFERPSIELLSGLKSIEGLSIAIELELEERNPDLFGGVIELRDKLYAAGFTSRDLKNEPRDAYARSLFTYEAGRPRDVAANIEQWSAVSPAEEIEEIAKRVKLIVRRDPEAATDLSKIAIAMPNVESYTPLVLEVFRRHEIPVQVADRYHLDQSPLVHALMAVLDMARHGIRERDLVRGIGSPYFEFVTSSGTTIDVQNLLEVLRAYRPSGDAAAWKKSLTAQIKRIEQEKDRSEDPIVFARLQGDEFHLQRALNDLSELGRIIRSIKSEMKPPEFCEAIRTLLRSLRLRDRLLAESRTTIAAGTLELDTRAYRALVKLIEDIASLFHMMEIDSEAFPLGFYVDRLKAALVIARYNPRPVSGAVVVTSLAQSIGLQPDYLFIAGLAEGALPTSYQPQVFLMDSLQKGESRQLLEERLLFYHAIKNYRKRLSLSYPSRTQSGGSLNHSIFLDALRAIVEIRQSERAEGVFNYRDLYLHESEGVEFEPLLSEAFYVKTIRDHIPRTTAMLDERMKSDRTTYRGWIDSSRLTKAEANILEENKTRIWSVTQLEMYANCPFKYFANYVLRLGEYGDTDEGLDARDRGSALHDVLREFLTSRREQKLPPVQDLNEAQLREAYSDVKKIATKHFEEISSDHPFWRLDAERLLSDEQQEGSVLWRFIKKEKELSKYESRPAFFEVSFGSQLTGENYDRELSSDQAVAMGGLSIRGKIDRIDIDNQSGTFTIIDYKSGKHTSKWSEIERGLSLQLPLYLRAAEDLLRSHVPPLRGVAALYHKVLDKDSARERGLVVREYAGKAFEEVGKARNGILDTVEELAAFIDETVQKSELYVNGIADGDFRLTEKDLVDKCKYCGYQASCRVREAIEFDVLIEP